MLATDRWAWSSKNGKKECRKDSFHLPNVCWEWDGDWFIDKSIECDVEVFLSNSYFLFEILTMRPKIFIYFLFLKFFLGQFFSSTKSEILSTNITANPSI